MKAVDDFNRLLALLAPFQRGASLPAPATEPAIAEVQRRIKYPLPPALVAVYGVCDGGPKVPDDSLAGNLFYSYRFLSVSELLDVHTRWQNVRRDYGREYPRDPIPSFPAGAVQDLLSCDAWISFADDGAGGNLAIDFAPGPSGVLGQVINFGRDDAAHFQLAAGFDEFLERVMRDYEAKKLHHVFGDSIMFVDRLIQLRQRRGGSDAG